MKKKSVLELISFYENKVVNVLDSDNYINAINQLPNEVIDDALTATLDMLQENIQKNPRNPMVSQKELTALKSFLTIPAVNHVGSATHENRSAILAQEPLSQTSETKYLIITSEGGAGHKEAASDSEKKLLANGLSPQAIKKVFVLPQENAPEKSWMRLFGIDFGKKGVRDWNKAQKEGNINKTKRMVSVQWLSEIIFGKSMERNTFLNLTKNQQILQVIDTQALNSHKIVSAVAEFNRIRTNEKKCHRFNQLVKFNQYLIKIPFLKVLANKKYTYPIQYNSNAKPVMIQKRMTDLPDRAEHFFNSLRKIKSRDLKYFSLEAPHAAQLRQDNIDPIQEKSFDLAYYRNKCPNLFNKLGEPLVEMDFSDGPIRQAFLHYKENPVDKSKDFTIQVKVANTAELDLVKQSVNLSHSPSKPLDPSKSNDAQTLEMTVPANAQVDSIMLGSQAAIDATMAYIDAKIEIQQSQSKHSPQFLFVFCGKHDSDNSLFAQVNQKIEDEKQKGNLPDSFTIVPLTYQDDQMIASLYSRADECFIRSGGISCMEIEAVSQGKVFIHSETQGANRTIKDLLKAMLHWERGNAEHVMTKLGKENVSIVNPQSYRKNDLEKTSSVKLNQDTRKLMLSRSSGQSKPSFLSKDPDGKPAVSHKKEARHRPKKPKPD